jgi:hypothetical protein
MNKTDPIRLNDDWVVSTNKYIYVVYLDNKICGYLKSPDEAANLLTSLGKTIEDELKQSCGKWKTITSKLIFEEDRAKEYLIYEQSLGYTYNNKPSLKHKLSYVLCYKAYNPSMEALKTVSEQSLDEDIKPKVKKEYFFGDLFRFN